MTSERKGILINAIIGVLNSKIRRENRELCAKNLHSQQKPLHGADMFFQLAYMKDDEIQHVAQACGL